MLASDTFATQRFWEGVPSEVTLVLEASGKVALTSREIFDALPAAVCAKFADIKGRDNPAWTGKLEAWAPAGIHLRIRDDGLYCLPRSN